MNELIDGVIFYLGSIATILLLLLAIIYLIYKITDWGYAQLKCVNEFTHWIVARRVLSRRRKRWQRFNAQGKLDPNGEYCGPNHRWNWKAYGPHPEEEEESRKWREQLVNRMTAAEKVCNKLNKLYCCECDVDDCEHSKALESELQSWREFKNGNY